MEIIVTEKIKDYLISKDEQLKLLFDRYGLISISSNESVFNSIIYHIVEQMLSVGAAKTIYNRLILLCGGSITPKTLNGLSVDQIKKCGVSYAKASYISNFCDDYIKGKFDFNNLPLMTETEVISYLTGIKGVGQWTAEMIALFVLGKENIFSFGDVALKNGIMKFKNYKSISKNRFEILKKKYSPYCSYISLYFYRYNDDKRYQQEKGI